MSELLRKQVDRVMKMKIPEANASPHKGCEENEEEKKENKTTARQKNFFREEEQQKAL